ncbi:MAG: molybdopterin-synthase adenylyltransferase MoeB [Gammaproteobacteria bacterium]|nr:molybdopterin-synthase adenylyltransferase MoeB [Gammaproteobacteria bacterium]NIM74477.1 molybdopterin-synthase adenylyltransferase MoeB [Gammaproteobacteria bacterium]NIO26310.1 molybdopterin-synthase adenylyltransferase MoeB [Gammaproteobacteria bacterium]NIO66862.1 molybdopterin-synthase adenylyltransferase MoeB [Gammaproteobacteria bacterium]NIP66071.1 molybdopterin-synthase adenylyltransferase MoeB [Gammaproteobacteria bacterium]
MTPEEKSRYSRHMLLAQIGAAGQERLLAARVLVVGMGGLGSPVAMYLAASGVGHLVLSDFDVVELSNLQRQIIHRSDDVDRNKVESARKAILALNPGVQVTALPYALQDDDLDGEVAAADVVVDACDNFQSRFEMNAACWRQRTPLVSAAAMRMEGQVSVFDPRQPESPCYRCLYSDESTEGEACSQVGVLAPLLGIVGSIQATEAMKLIVGMGTTLVGRVLVLDALDMELRTLKLRKDPQCPVCSEPAGARASAGG